MITVLLPLFLSFFIPRIHVLIYTFFIFFFSSFIFLPHLGFDDYNSFFLLPFNYFTIASLHSFCCDLRDPLCIILSVLIILNIFYFFSHYFLNHHFDFLFTYCLIYQSFLHRYSRIHSHLILYFHCVM